jgi:hypothetical protein
VIAVGTPEEIAAAPLSATGDYLRPLLNRGSAGRARVTRPRDPDPTVRGRGKRAAAAV